MGRAAAEGEAVTAPELRPYQVDVLDRVAAAVEGGHRRILLVAPTGSGKTVIAAAAIRDAVARGERVLFLAHRRELIGQAQNKLFAAGVDAGIILAGVAPRSGEAVQIASVQTLWARAIRTTRIEMPPAELVVVDEAHHVRARTYGRILEAYPQALVLGLTATPCRGDGRGLGNAFDVLVECPPVAELIALGHLVPTRVFAPTRPDLTGVRVERGDYVESQLATVMDTGQLVGDIVEHWLRLAERRKTVVFATGVAHSVHIRDEFRRAGVLAEHIDGSTPTDEREGILKRLARGGVEVLTNCAVLTEGWDSPDASCLVLARPTKHHGLFRQMLGRVLRPAPGKSDALVLDHAGAVFQHGFVEEPVEWTLAADERAVVPAQAARAARTMPALTTCPECGAVRMEGKPCPVCGWRPVPKPRGVDVAEGDLGRVDHMRRVSPQDWTSDERQSFHRQLVYIAAERGYKPGWASHKFKERFGTWPAERFPVPEPPDDATRRWVRSRQIAYARSMAKAS